VLVVLLLLCVFMRHELMRLAVQASFAAGASESCAGFCDFGSGITSTCADFRGRISSTCADFSGRTSSACADFRGFLSPITRRITSACEDFRGRITAAYEDSGITSACEDFRGRITSACADFRSRITSACADFRGFCSPITRRMHFTPNGSVSTAVTDRCKKLEDGFTSAYTGFRGFCAGRSHLMEPLLNVDEEEAPAWTISGCAASKAQLDPSLDVEVSPASLSDSRCSGHLDSFVLPTPPSDKYYVESSVASTPTNHNMSEPEVTVAARAQEIASPRIAPRRISSRRLDKDKSGIGDDGALDVGALSQSESEYWHVVTDEAETDSSIAEDRSEANNDEENESSHSEGKPETKVYHLY
jgi:hypothetical protein